VTRRATGATTPPPSSNSSKSARSPTRGVPLSKVRELLTANDEEFAAALQNIDQRLRSEIRERQRHRERVTQLMAGDSLALPAEAVAYLDKMRDHGFPNRLIEIERDSWILIAAQMPNEVPAFMAIKHAQIDNDILRQLYLDIADLADCTPDDPRLPALADHVEAFLQAVAAEADWESTDEQPISADLVALLDAMFIESFPSATSLLKLLEARGWTGWTNIRRTNPSSIGGENHRAPSTPV
jgi:DNA-binding transcriptional MerR regulator